MSATMSSLRSLRWNKTNSFLLIAFILMNAKYSSSCQSLELLSPFPLQHLDRELKEINAFIRADSRISANPVMKVLFGDPRLFLASLPQTSLIHSTSLWSCREKVSLLSLTHYVEQKDGKDNLPVLWRFLHKVKKTKNKDKSLAMLKAPDELKMLKYFMLN